LKIPASKSPTDTKPENVTTHFNIDNMVNYIEFKNGILIGDSIICLVDDVNEENTFGFTDNPEKIEFNIKLISSIFDIEKFEKHLSNSKQGLTTLFPLGRYIVILIVSKDKKTMKQFFLDFRIEYQDIDKYFVMFSNNVKNQFKSIKYYVEDFFSDDFDIVFLSTELEANTL
jgi:hypothetical protein